MQQSHHQFPESLPDTINDDALAQTIMLHLGVWDDVSKRRSITSTVTIVVADTHPTHWCLCARHWNNPDPEANGFQVIAYPKNLVQRLEVEALMHRYLEGATEVMGVPIDLKPWE